MSDFRVCSHCFNMGDKPCTCPPEARPDAGYFLREAQRALQDRAAVRDQEQERSMARAVSTFNALTGLGMSETDGWVFMCVLKLARARQGAFHADDWTDLAGYAGLAGESAAR